MSRISKPPSNLWVLVLYFCAFAIIVYILFNFLTFGSLVFDVNYVEANLESLDADDSQLVQYTRIRHLTPPSNLPYSLNHSRAVCSNFCSEVRKIFKDKRGGKFIEAGAHDGDSGSHSLYLEMNLGWEGLLVECNPTLIPHLTKKHRKAWMAQVCLSTTGQATTLNFSHPVSWTYSGRIGKPWGISKEWLFFDVPAIPLYTILAAIGWTEIDYFSFDIEGQELSVFKTFPFDKVIFKLLIVEVHFYKPEEKEELHKLLSSNQYVLYKNMSADYMYYHEKFQNELSLN